MMNWQLASGFGTGWRTAIKCFMPYFIRIFIENTIIRSRLLFVLLVTSPIFVKLTIIITTTTLCIAKVLRQKLYNNNINDNKRPLQSWKQEYKLTSFRESSLSFRDIWNETDKIWNENQMTEFFYHIHTFEIFISFITYCFPSFLLFTSNAFPKEPSPIFRSLTNLSILTNQDKQLQNLLILYFLQIICHS